MKKKTNSGKIFLATLPGWNAFCCKHTCMTGHYGNVFFDPQTLHGIDN